MARKPFSTFTKADSAKLKSVVSQFNKKRNQAAKTIQAQPERIKYSEIIKTVRSRAEFNRVVNVYSRYLKRGAEKTYTNQSGAVTTRWQRNENRYAAQRINAARARKREQIGATSKAIQEELNLVPFRDHTKTITTTEGLRKYSEGLQRQANSQYFALGEAAYKRNYLQSLVTVYEGLPGFRKLYKFIQGLSGADLLEGAARDPTLEISFQYGFEEASMKLEYLTEAWSEYTTDPND